MTAPFFLRAKPTLGTIEVCGFTETRDGKDRNPMVKPLPATGMWPWLTSLSFFPIMRKT